MATPYRDAVNVDTPVGFWRLDEATGTVATDTGSGAQNGTYSGGFTLAQTVSAVTDAGNTGVLFDGVNGHAVATIAAGPAATNTTIELLLLAPTLTSKGNFVKVGDSNGYGIGVGSGNTDTNGNHLLILYENIRWIDTGFVLVAATWYHVALVINSTGKPTVYVNGSSVYSDTGSSPQAPTGSVYIASGNGAARFAKSVLNMVAIYSAALTATQIGNHYATLYGGKARDSQEAVEVVLVPTSGKARASQEPIEVVLVPTSQKARISQQPIETVIVPTSQRSRVSQVAIEAVTLRLRPIRVSQEAIETVIRPTSQRARLSQYVIEVVTGQRRGKNYAFIIG